MKLLNQSSWAGIGLILLAFWAGSQKNLLLSLAGFLSFFTLGVTLIIESKKASQKSNHD